MKYRSLILLFLIFFLSIAYCLNMSAKNKKKISNIGDAQIERVGILALVNGKPITLLDVLRLCGPEEARLPYMFQGRMLEEQVVKLRLEALEEVINRKLIYSEFSTKKFELPISYIQMYLDKIAESYNVNDQKSLRELVEAKGQSYEDFKREAYENAAVNALINDRCYTNINVTPEQIFNYYKKYENKFITPEQIEIQILKLKMQGMHRKEIDSLSDILAETFKNADKRAFDDAVLMYSEGPEVQNGGNIGWIERDKLRKDFAKAVKYAKVGDVVGPIKSKEAYYFLRVNDKKTKVVETFKDAKDNIKDKLTMEKKKKEYDAFIKNLRNKSSIEYMINK
jgi:peptidyl-prolyl cis-trans isomerase SurA